MNSLTTKAYYFLKPIIPRSVQILLRRIIIQKMRAKYVDVWPIDERASKKLLNWKRWPEGKTFALVLTHDVDTARGQERCGQLMHLEEELGFRSSFNFVPERYRVSPELRRLLIERKFEVGVHGLKHDGKYYNSREIFSQRAKKINNYLKDWLAVGYRAPSMLHKLDWFHDLNIEYDASTFDTDPFEPNSEGMRTIFPFLVEGKDGSRGYVELPYTLPQDHALFVMMREKTIDIWKRKLDWIASNGGMALMNVHPDYMNFAGTRLGLEEYPAGYYREFLSYVKSRYEGQYWHVLPKEIARFWKDNQVQTRIREDDAARRHGLTGVNVRLNKKTPMRVCMLAYTFYESDTRVRLYAETLAAQGHQVDAVALREEGQPRYGSLNGVRIFRIQKRVRDEKNKLSYLYRLLRFFINSAFFVSKQHIQRRYDLIHVHSVPDFEVFATFFAKITGARIVLDIHDIVPEFYASKFNVNKESAVFKALALIEKASIAFSDHVIIANHIWEKTLTSRSVKKDKCTTMLNYPDLSIFYRRPRTRNDGKFIVIFPGTISWHQGLDIAIKAFAHIKDELPEAEFHIYGDGPMKAAIQNLIIELGLQERVILKGTLSSEQIAEVMANADLGVVPKRNDPFGGDAFSTKIFEFMALGVPVVASATRIDRYYFNDSNVRFFEPENATDLALNIKELARSQELRERLTANASAFINDYTWDKKEMDYLSLVYKLVGQKAD